MFKFEGPRTHAAREVQHRAMLDTICPCVSLAKAEQEQLTPLTESTAAPSTPPSALAWVMDAGRRIVSGTDPALEPMWELMAAGETMRLVSGRQSEDVRVTLSSDRTMLLWKPVQAGPSSLSGSGAVGLSTIQRVQEPAAGWLSSPSPGEFVITADGLEVMRAHLTHDAELWRPTLSNPCISRRCLRHTRCVSRLPPTRQKMRGLPPSGRPVPRLPTTRALTRRLLIRTARRLPDSS